MGRPNTSRGRGVFYGWWLVGLVGVVIAATTNPLGYAPVIWDVALGRDFDWWNDQTTFVWPIILAVIGLGAPVQGYLADRMGARRMVVTGFCVLGGAFVFFSLIQHPSMLYAGFVLLATGGLLTGWIPLMTTLSRWFVRRRATAIAVAYVVSGVLGIVPGPFLGWFVNIDGGPLGWRLSAIVLGGFTLIAAVPVFFLLRNRPEDMGLLPDGGPSSVEAQQCSLSIGQSFRTRAFWLITFGHSVASMSGLVIVGFLNFLIEDKGFTRQDTSFFLSLYIFVSLWSQLVGGFVGDRVPKSYALAFFTVLQTVGLLLAVIADSRAGMYLFAALMGLGVGGRSPVTVAILADYFGTGSLGKILGFSAFPIALLLLLAVPFAGWIGDVRGEYTIAFVVLAALNLAGAVCFLLARRPGPRSPQVAPAVPALP